MNNSFNQKETEEQKDTPFILARPYHNLSRKLIDPDALTVLYRLKNAGYIAYLVGGAVRDILLGITPKDFDVATDAHPKQVRKLFKNCYLVGRRFRLAHIYFGKKIIETATFRRDPIQSQENLNTAQFYVGHIHENTFGTPREDAFRRDFTINGLFYDIKTFCIIDYVNGIRDIKLQLVRSIGAPDIRYREDPVRMLRAIRLAARLNFQIENETSEAIYRNHQYINMVSMARLNEEIYKLFYQGCSVSIFRMLCEYNLFSQLFPNIGKIISQQNTIREQLMKYLDALDLMLKEGLSLTPEIIIGLIYLAPFLHDMQTGEKKYQNNKHYSANIASKYLKPFFIKYSASKIVYHRLINIYSNIFFLRDKKYLFYKQQKCKDWLWHAIMLINIQMMAEKRVDTEWDKCWRKICSLHHPSIKVK